MKLELSQFFKEEALFSGTLYIKSETYEPEGYELAVNKGAMGYFKEMRIVCSYQNIKVKYFRPSVNLYTSLKRRSYLEKTNSYMVIQEFLMIITTLILMIVIESFGWKKRSMNRGHLIETNLLG